MYKSSQNADSKKNRNRVVPREQDVTPLAVDRLGAFSFGLSEEGGLL